MQYTLNRNRDEVKNQHRIRQLAGVQEYSASEISHSTPLLEMEEGQLQGLLQQLQ